MISEIAWENVRWIQENIFDRWEQFGGKMIAVDSFRPYLKRAWIKRLRPSTARHRFLKELNRWAAVASHEYLFAPEYTTDYSKDPPEAAFLSNVPLFHGELTELYWFMLRAHFNLYCLATHRKTIEELALGAYAYCSKTERHTKEFDEAARRDLWRLLSLSNSFLLAQWVQDMVERAVSNRDKAFFTRMSNAIQRDLMDRQTGTAKQWLLVTLLWYLGGRNMKPQREFLQLLKKEQILPSRIPANLLNHRLRTLVSSGTHDKLLSDMPKLLNHGLTSSTLCPD